MTLFYPDEPEIHRSILEKNNQKLDELVYRKIGLKEVNRYGLTALDLAQYLGREESVNILKGHRQRYVKYENDDGLLEEITWDEFHSKFGVRYTPTLRFENYGALIRVVNNCPWFIQSFLGENNRKLGDMYHWEINNGFLTDCYVKKTNDEIGYGLYALKDLSEGFFVGEYTGFVRSISRLHPNLNEYCVHYPTKFFSWNYTVIDALEEGNLLRFANHSDQPNLTPQWVCLNKIMHLIFIANQPIAKGAELTINYGKDFWKKRKKL